MRKLKIAGAVLGVLVVGVLAVGAMLPKTYAVERSMDIKAEPAVVFAEVNSLKRWDAWSPWIARDPSIKNTHSGPEAGVGATVSWTSESSGDGTQKIVLSEAPGRIQTELDFGADGTSTANWYFEAKDGGTHVRWGLSGEATGLLGGYFAKMIEGFVAADYEDGLARLKKHVESAAG